MAIRDLLLLAVRVHIQQRLQVGAVGFRLVVVVSAVVGVVAEVVVSEIVLQQ